MLRYLFIIFILSGCVKNQPLKTERSHIDSLFLVKSIPVAVIDSLPQDGSAFVSMFSQQLISDGFSLITPKGVITLTTEYRNRSKLSSTDPNERQRVMALLSQNPDYFSDEMKRARPYAQTVKILPCYPAKEGCIEIKRNNHPYAVKTRKWAFNKREDMTEESFVSHIISVLAPATP